MHNERIGTSAMTYNAPCFLHVPQTEQEVVCLFGALVNDLDEFERPLIIERVQTGFPDCTVRAGGKLIRIEFELYGSNFNHDCAGCDVLVCWRDDRNDWPEGFRVVQLVDVVAIKKRQGMFVSLDEDFPAPWNEETFFAAGTRDGTSEKDLAFARQIIELAKQRKWGPMWLVNPKPLFAVGTPQFFKVDARGRIAFPFSRLKAAEAFDELAERLNGVVPALRITSSDIDTKSKGGQLADLFVNDEQIRAFFDVWGWFQARA
jgi:hypothetical protein